MTMPNCYDNHRTISQSYDEYGDYYSACSSMAGPSSSSTCIIPEVPPPHREVPYLYKIPQRRFSPKYRSRYFTTSVAATEESHVKLIPYATTDNSSTFRSDSSFTSVSGSVNPYVTASSDSGNSYSSASCSSRSFVSASDDGNSLASTSGSSRPFDSPSVSGNSFHSTSGSGRPFVSTSDSGNSFHSNSSSGRPFVSTSDGVNSFDSASGSGRPFVSTSDGGNSFDSVSGIRNSFIPGSDKGSSFISKSGSFNSFKIPSQPRPILPSTSKTPTEVPLKKRKRSKYSDKSEKICAVCGDVAKSMHFGGMACDSCKAFFRRSVQSDTYGSFVCSANKQCPVIKDNKRICQYCRFEKCRLKANMEVRWVMSKADRMTLWKSKIDKHRDNVTKEENQVDNCPQNPGHSGVQISSPKSLEKLCNPTAQTPRIDDSDAINHLIMLQELVFKSMPYPTDCDGDSTASLANLFYCVCQRLRIFFYRLEDFREISVEDQPALLKNGIGMSIYLHGAYNYDIEKREWPDMNAKEALKMPNVSTKTLRMFTFIPKLFDALMLFYDNYSFYLKDEAVLVLVCLITLFDHLNLHLSSRVYVDAVRNRYIHILRNYLCSLEGEKDGDLMLGNLLNGLVIVKKIVSFHQMVDIRHSVGAVQMIRKNHDSFKNQMVAISHVLTNAIRMDIDSPIHASVLKSEEVTNVELSKRKLGLSFRRPQYLPNPRVDSAFFHPITNGLFEPNITNRLISFGKKNVLDLRPNVRNMLSLNHTPRLLSIAGPSNVQDPPRKEMPALEPLYGNSEFLH